jgi:hypothetical protein
MKGGNENPCSINVLNAARGDDFSFADVAIKPGVV